MTAPRGLEDGVQAEGPRREFASQIIARVARAHRISPVRLTSPDRHRPVARARQHAMFELRRHTRLSLRQIARQVGVKDHKTVSYGLQAHEARLGVMLEPRLAETSGRRR